MIPLRDENPSGTFPVVTLALIATNVLVFIYEASQGLDPVIARYGLVPASVWSLAGEAVSLGAIPAVTADVAAELAARVPDAVARAPLAPLHFVTAMFLHAGIMHIVGNMWFLWLFGDNIEDRLGHVGFTVFYFVCGLGASAAHVFFTGPTGVGAFMPMVGASGAIAGVLGAYFICFPRAKVLTIVPIFFILFLRLPAFVFLLLWLLGQVSGVLSPEGAGIAWWAHIGGFALGAALALVWPKCKRSRQSDYEAKPDVWRAKRRGMFG
ncbi:MAG: rhomboid family intramembrane serine protease [Planctomycetota bacterium]